jgi:hypothetical protein
MSAKIKAYASRKASNMVISALDSSTKVLRDLRDAPEEAEHQKTLFALVNVDRLHKLVLQRAFVVDEIQKRERGEEILSALASDANEGDGFPYYNLDDAQAKRTCKEETCTQFEDAWLEAEGEAKCPTECKTMLKWFSGDSGRTTDWRNEKAVIDLLASKDDETDGPDTDVDGGATVEDENEDTTVQHEEESPEDPSEE